MRIEVPVSDELRGELVGFWDGVLGPITDISNRGFFEQELEDNRNVLYMEKRDGRVAGACMITTNRSGRKLGAFGHVATDPGFRRSGIATAVCGQAVEEFRADGGEAVFLGTHSPGSGNGNAARVYHRLGWRFMAGSEVMANVSNGDSPEEYLVDYFGEGGPITVREASAADRVLITPLIVAPHDWQVLDSNALGNIYSTRYITQGMCNGLYRQYEEVRDGGRGNWFAARTDDGRVVGLATARLTEDDACRVDGFAHRRHTGAWPDLVGAATDWAQRRGAQDCFAMVCVEDEEKQAAFEELGFGKKETSATFSIGERTVGAVRMEL